MRLVIDARSLKTRKRNGVARFLESILMQLEGKPGIHIILVSNSPIYYETTSDHVESRYYRCCKYLPGTFFINFIVPLLNFGTNVIFWGPSFAIPLFGHRTIVTIHDLVAFEYPETMTAVGRVLTYISTILSVKFTDRITVVSEFTKERLIKIIGSKMGQKKIINIVTNGFNSDIFHKIEPITPSDIPFIMYLGTLEPRKNIPLLVSIFDGMKNKGYKGNLKLIGTLGWGTRDILDKINNSSFKSEIYLLGHIEDEKINELMNQSDLFIFPSWYEGFGLPPLEALAAGCKVLCTKYCALGNYDNKSTLLRIFDPQSATADELVTLAMLMIQEKKPIEVPRMILSDYSWERSTNQLLTVIESFKSISTGNI